MEIYIQVMDSDPLWEDWHTVIYILIAIVQFIMLHQVNDSDTLF